MRRLLALLIALSALFAVSPCVAAPAEAMPHAMAGMPTMPCHDDHGAAQGLHACLGCAVQPDAAMHAVQAVVIATIPIARPATPLLDHATGFDPPPPRAVV